MKSLEVKIRKPISLKAYVGCHREIDCDRCPNEVECLIEVVKNIDWRTNRRVKPEKEVVRY